ncbi:MAG: hypothetical protein UY21_C0014G0003 [Microgenomates group bacterium GW2011_GWA1_48_10]|nr:MAG: hypothetical protein UY21_C0014G0003 [Microgenomates group bacterium GW2011_GWA1_48_10]
MRHRQGIVILPLLLLVLGFLAIILTSFLLVSSRTGFSNRASGEILNGGPQNPQEIPVKVAVLVYDPPIISQGGKSLTQVLGWNNGIQMAHQLVSDFNTFTHGVIKYQIVEESVRPEWIDDIEGKHYPEEVYLNPSTRFTYPLKLTDYVKIVKDNHLDEKIRRGEIDEVWLWGYPGTPGYESVMMGDGAYWINGGPISGIDTKAFIMMGFTYDRYLSEALESYGHRTESIMRRIYGSWEAKNTHDWNKFTLLDRGIPGFGGIGNAHNAFNAEPGTDYNRSSLRMLPTSADDWYNFPNMTGARTQKNCTAWNCNGYEYLKWWYDHMPHVGGLKNDILNNWWRYIVIPDEYKTTWKFSAVSEARSDLTENNASSWNCGGVSATCSLASETSLVRSGSNSLHFVTNGAFDTWLRFPKDQPAVWNLTAEKYLVLWAYAINKNLSFQGNSPTIYLKNNTGGQIRYLPVGNPLDSARNQWKKIVIPLSGDSNWQKSSTGTIDLSRIDSLEIHADTWDAGFEIYFDGLGFSSSDKDTTPPTVTIAEPGSSFILTDETRVTVNASDNSSILRVDLFIDGQYQQTDAIWPYIFSITASNLSASPHTLTVRAIDIFGNESPPATTNFALSNNPPSAKFSMTLVGPEFRGDPKFTVNFTNKSTDPDSDPITYLWNFGDGSAISQMNSTKDPTHQYAPHKSYQVTLTVSDSRKGVSKLTKNLTIP